MAGPRVTTKRVGEYEVRVTEYPSLDDVWCDWEVHGPGPDDEPDCCVGNGEHRDAIAAMALGCMVAGAVEGTR